MCRSRFLAAPALVVILASLASGQTCLPALDPPASPAFGVCGDPNAGDCCQANSTPGCEDLGCCETVCNVDPYCCEVVWDGICVGEAIDLCCLCSCCVGCGNSESGDCCVANGSPFCDNYGCCQTVCAFDPWCCEVEWDTICAEEAAEYCAPCGACFNAIDWDVTCHADGATFTYTVEGTNVCTGALNTYTFTASGGAAGQQMCFTILVESAQGGFCCSTQLCLTVPDCSAGGSGDVPPWSQLFNADMWAWFGVS